ncbi:MAG: type VI secretion system baseplate subunit TssE [Myxococcales bacterium]|nr:type VI secretion system baseplate subunit TssE [Myxococcales bacterium]
MRLARAADPTNVERHTWKANDLAADVMEHIKQLLSTRQGSSLTAPDYGVPDVTELLHEMSEAIAVTQRAVKQSLQTYEPRLKNVQVRHVRNENAQGQPAMVFEITGHIVLGDGRKQALRIGTTVDEHGIVNLEEL